MTHKQQVLLLLADGREHDSREGYRLGVMLHSRVADLRKDGYVIDCRRTGGAYLYRLCGNVNDIAGATEGAGPSGNPPAPALSVTSGVPSPIVEAAAVSEREEEFSWSVVGDGQLSLEQV